MITEMFQRVIAAPLDVGLLGVMRSLSKREVGAAYRGSLLLRSVAKTDNIVVLAFSSMGRV